MHNVRTRMLAVAVLAVPLLAGAGKPLTSTSWASAGSVDAMIDEQHIVTGELAKCTADGPMNAHTAGGTTGDIAIFGNGTTTCGRNGPVAVAEAQGHRFEADVLKRFGGPVITVRLAPVDYHHVHYPDTGKTLEQDRLGRRNWTVNWHALQAKEDILFENERQVNILETRNFGRLGFVEIGALTVGRIVQVHPLDAPYNRGDEKSVFRFGGSSIVLFGQPGAWRPSDDLLRNTSENIETFVRLGDGVAKAP